MTNGRDVGGADVDRIMLATALCLTPLISKVVTSIDSRELIVADAATHWQVLSPMMRQDYRSADRVGSGGLEPFCGDYVDHIEAAVAAGDSGDPEADYVDQLQGCWRSYLKEILDRSLRSNSVRSR